MWGKIGGIGVAFGTQSPAERVEFFFFFYDIIALYMQLQSTPIFLVRMSGHFNGHGNYESWSYLLLDQGLEPSAGTVSLEKHSGPG